MENEDFMGRKTTEEADPVGQAEEPLTLSGCIPCGMPDEKPCGGKQAAVALAMIREHLPPEDVLERAGVSEAEFADWIREGAFPKLVSSLARGFAEADAPYVWDALLREAKDGNVPAIRLYFEFWSKIQPVSASREAVPPIRDREVESLRSDLFGV